MDCFGLLEPGASDLSSWHVCSLARHFVAGHRHSGEVRAVEAGLDEATDAAGGHTQLVVVVEKFLLPGEGVLAVAAAECETGRLGTAEHRPSDPGVGISREACRNT